MLQAFTILLRAARQNKVETGRERGNVYRSLNPAQWL